MAETIKIRHAGWVYNKKHSSIDTNGKKVTTWHPVMAQRGEVLKVDDIHEADFEKGHEDGAFWTNDYDPETGVPKGFDGPSSTQFTDAEVELGDDTPNMEEATDVDLVDWVQNVTVKAIVALAGDNPDYAARLLDAEIAASGDDPRPTLVRALDKIVGE